MARTPMSIEDVTILGGAYPDPAEWARVSHDGTHLEWPDDLDPSIASIDMPAARKTWLLNYARLRRWQVETGGIVVDGMPIATDDRSKLMIAGARTSADADPDFQTEWDAGSSDVTLNAEQIVAISDAVRDHVAAAFATFKTVRAGINSDEITDKAAVDAAFSD